MRRINYFQVTILGLAVILSSLFFLPTDSSYADTAKKTNP